MKCSVCRTGEIVSSHVKLATNFMARLKGLMFCKTLPAGDSLLLDPCPQIHTCFMRFQIDVIFLDHQNRVVAVRENIKPWRMTRFYLGAKRALELPGNSLQGRVHCGDELIFN